MAAEPAELLAERLRPLAIDERSSRAEKCPQPPDRDAELMQALGIRRRGGCPGRGRAARGSRRRARSPSASPGGVSFVSFGGVGRPVQAEHAVELRLELARSRGHRPCAAPWRAGASAFSSPSISSTSTSRKRWETRWPTSTATLSSTISAPWARTTSRRVRRRATGTSAAPRRYAASRSTSSAGGRAGGPPQLELEPGRVARQLQLPQPGPVLDAMPKRDPVAREAQVGACRDRSR